MVLSLPPLSEEKLESRLVWGYQLDFVTPGSSPRKARFRKQILHKWNLR